VGNHINEGKNFARGCKNMSQLGGKESYYSERKRFEEETKVVTKRRKVKRGIQIKFLMGQR